MIKMHMDDTNAQKERKKVTSKSLVEPNSSMQLQPLTSIFTDDSTPSVKMLQ